MMSGVGLMRGIVVGVVVAWGSDRVVWGSDGGEMGVISC